MKYTCEIIIDLPRDKVIELFDSIENLYKWQEGLKNFEVVSGTPGEDGLKSRLTYVMKSKEMVMQETIEKFDFPNQLIAIYEAKNVWNRCINDFEDLGNKTKWSMESEFLCDGFMKLMTTFGKGAFRKETMKSMNSFKNFAEGNKERVV